VVTAVPPSFSQCNIVDARRRTFFQPDYPPLRDSNTIKSLAETGESFARIAERRNEA
jgi:hypothetical protein